MIQTPYRTPHGHPKPGIRATHGYGMGAEGLEPPNLTDVFTFAPTRLENVLADFLTSRDLAGVRKAMIIY